MFRTSHPRFDLVVSDIDGCLQPESTAPMDLASLATIAAWNRAATEHKDRPLVTFCSGRPQPFVEAMCKLLANIHAPAVAENGVWVYDPSDNRYLMDPSISQSDLDAVREAAAWLAREHGPRGVSQQPGKTASISLYHPDTRVLKEAWPSIAEEFDRRGWPLRVSMTWLYINCDLQHVSKKTGLQRALKLAGVDSARVAGIGDTMGDLAIREHASFFACPVNAADDIKLRADYVAADAEARGVLQILQQIKAG